MYEDSDDEEITPEEHRRNIDDLCKKVLLSNESRIDCSYKQFTDNELEHLAFVLKGKKIVYLDLSSNMLNKNHMQALQKIIIHCPSLVRINLQFNKIDDAAIFQLVANNLVQQRLPDLDLIMFVNSFGKMGLIEGAKYMSADTVSSMTNCPYIKDPDLTNQYDAILQTYYRRLDMGSSNIPFNLFLFSHLSNNSTPKKATKLADQCAQKKVKK